MQRNWKKLFHVLHRLDIRAYYAKEKINLTCLINDELEISSDETDEEVTSEE